MRIIYTENNTKICNSYLLGQDDSKIGDIVIEILRTRRDRGLPITREPKSYTKEIKAHNRLYKLGMFKSHTKDCDCEENIKKWKNVVYSIIGL